MKKYKEKFDSLVKDYDAYRPRYPDIFFQEIWHWSNQVKPKQHIIDIGAGTGILLEGLIPRFSQKHQFFAIDISEKMVSYGVKKFPFITWIHGQAETILSNFTHIDIALFGQSLQWLQRKNILHQIKERLNNLGMVCILQNNRDYQKNNFLYQYENLLEYFHPKYIRTYRQHNYRQELQETFNNHHYIFIYLETIWEHLLSKHEFIGMSNSSTQIQTIKLRKANQFQEKLHNLISKYIQNEKLLITYQSELFIIKKK